MSDMALASNEPLSTTLTADEGNASAAGGGTPRTLADDDTGLSLRDTIAGAVKEADAAAKADAGDDGDAKPDDKTADKPDDKAAKDDKPAKARAEDGKFAKADKADAGDADASKADADGKADGDDSAVHDAKGNAQQRDTLRHKPPQSFMPDSKAVWGNVPNAVRRDIETMVQTHTSEIERAREASDRYAPIKHYDDHLRNNGSDLGTALNKMVALETAMRANPLQALNQMLIEGGPRKADGTPLSLYEVAQYVVSQGPQGYSEMMQQVNANQARSQQPAEDPRIAHMQETIARLQGEQLVASVIEPFKATHPRYDELEGDIAFFLESGKVPQGLSALERLEIAYDMAARINPASNITDRDDAAPPSKARPADLRGSKSIKSAPGAISQDVEPERGGSIRDLLQEEIRRGKRA